MLAIGGGVATLFGFLDDLQDIRAKNKLGTNFVKWMGYFLA